MVVIDLHFSRKDECTCATFDNGVRSISLRSAQSRRNDPWICVMAEKGLDRLQPRTSLKEGTLHIDNLR
jgi:hypothetical protein